MFFFLCKLVCESALTHMRTSGILPSSDAMEGGKKKRRRRNRAPFGQEPVIQLPLLFNYCIAYPDQPAEGKETLLTSLSSN